jgi:hypothetical protein
MGHYVTDNFGLLRTYSLRKEKLDMLMVPLSIYPTTRTSIPDDDIMYGIPGHRINWKQNFLFYEYLFPLGLHIKEFT